VSVDEPIIVIFLLPSTSTSDEKSPETTDEALFKFPAEPLLLAEPASVVTKTLPLDTVLARVDREA
jgi:hypothetical protein